MVPVPGRNPNRLDKPNERLEAVGRIPHRLGRLRPAATADACRVILSGPRPITRPEVDGAAWRLESFFGTYIAAHLVGSPDPAARRRMRFRNRRPSRSASPFRCIRRQAGFMGFSGIESSFDEFLRRGLTIGTQPGRISPTPSRRCMRRPMNPEHVTQIPLSASVDFTDADYGRSRWAMMECVKNLRRHGFSVS